MNLNINIKKVGFKYGTIGWLRNAIATGDIILYEANSWYIPIWGNDYGHSKILTHGLVISDKEKKNNALLAYRKINGEYGYSVKNALAEDDFGHWALCLTDAAINALENICEAWMEIQEQETEEQEEITITIKTESRD